MFRSIPRFVEVVEEAGKNFAPNIVANYLFDLAQKYNLFYNKHSILNPEQIHPGGVMASQVQPATPGVGIKVGIKSESVRTFRLALTEATANILKRGLYLLGIETVERM